VRIRFDQWVREDRIHDLTDANERKFASMKGMASGTKGFGKKPAKTAVASTSKQGTFSLKKPSKLPSLLKPSKLPSLFKPLHAGVLPSQLPKKGRPLSKVLKKPAKTTPVALPSSFFAAVWPLC